MSALTTDAPRRQTGGRKKSKLGWNLLGLLVFVVVGFPLYWMLDTAFK